MKVANDSQNALYLTHMGLSRYLKLALSIASSPAILGKMATVPQGCKCLHNGLKSDQYSLMEKSVHIKCIVVLTVQYTLIEHSECTEMHR